MDRLTRGQGQLETVRQVDRLHALLLHVTYKPGWSVTAASIDSAGMYDSGILLRVQWPAMDVVTRQAIMLHHQCAYSWRDFVRMADGDIIRHVVGRAIYEAEMHEMHEWFKFRGYHVIDPHPEVNKHGKKESRANTTTE